jgi:hypothetical protein
MEQNGIAWAKENNKDPNARRSSFKNNGSGEGRVKGKIRNGFLLLPVKTTSVSSMINRTLGMDVSPGY